MRPRVYIATSVIGGCLDDEFADGSNRLFDEFRAGTKAAIVSDLTRRELEEAPVPLLTFLFLEHEKFE